MRWTVQNKVWMVLSLVAVAAVAQLGYVRYSHDRTIQALVRNAEKEFDVKLSDREIPVQTFINDYSYWDDLVGFLSNKNQHWASQNIAPCLAQYSTDAIWVYSTKEATPVYAVSRHASKEFAALPVAQDVRQMFSKNRFCHFFVMTPKGLMEIYGASVHPTADSERKTPPQGYLLAGRIWDPKLVASLARDTGGPVILISPKHGPKSSCNDVAGTITFAKALRGFDGKPVMFASVNMPFPAVKGVTSTFNRPAYPLMVLSLALIGFLFFFFRNHLVLPLRHIARSLETGDPVPAALLQSDASEFGYIARTLTEQFEERRRLLQEVESLKNAEEESSREINVLTRKAQSLENEIALLRDAAQHAEQSQEAATVVAAAPADVEELRKQLETRTSELFVVNELLQREIISEHEHHKAEMMARYEREQLETELAKVRAALEDTTRELAAAHELLKNGKKVKNNGNGSSNKKQILGDNMPKITASAYSSDTAVLHASGSRTPSCI